MEGAEIHKTILALTALERNFVAAQQADPSL